MLPSTTFARSRRNRLNAPTGKIRVDERRIGLLYAQARAIPLFGRDEMLQSLETWANSRSASSPISIRVIVGGGGSGKTRLAMDLCDRLSDAGWRARRSRRWRPLSYSARKHSRHGWRRWREIIETAVRIVTRSRTRRYSTRLPLRLRCFRVMSKLDGPERGLECERRKVARRAVRVSFSAFSPLC